MSKPTTLVIGASENSDRYSNMAIKMLREYGYPVKAIGLREGKVLDVEIKKPGFVFENIDTVTMYVGPQNQPTYYDYILQLKPRRVIFNPGTENDSFEQILNNAGIITEKACTLVLLRTGAY
jgi:predicted CoA-binding protein